MTTPLKQRASELMSRGRAPGRVDTKTAEVGFLSYSGVAGAAA